MTGRNKQKTSKKEVSIARSSTAEYLIFIAATGEGGVEAVYVDENIWLTQKMLAVLYDADVRTINYHLKKIFNDSELEENSVIRNFRITASDGKKYNTKHYNLAAIIAVGYKVNSERAVQFRKWATTVIKEFTIKGYTMDDERLKSGGSILSDQYFEEQLERIRETRLNRFIAATDRDILQDAGKVTAEIAKAHAESEFEKYRIIQDCLYTSDFDLLIQQAENEKKK
ncbi:virulence RhuM family protein [Desulfobulbus sp. US1]|nr:virulence RhuM family protein [Desulfobulbus sp. US4]MCW5209833.1 virulence RhuM family protein [Desulfobulbus sp. US1]